MRYFVQREKDHEMRNLVRKLTPALTGGVLIYKDSNINMAISSELRSAVGHESGQSNGASLGEVVRVDPMISALMSDEEDLLASSTTIQSQEPTGCPKLLHATDTAVMELIDNLRNAVLQQREQEVTNFFTNVNKIEHGHRVAHYAGQLECSLEEVREALNELNSVNRKPFIAQVTVWDSKKKVGSPKTGRMNFRVGAVYEFKQVHSVGYFSDIAKGSVQLEDGASDRVVERLAPVLKRKAGLEPSGRHPKARALLQHDESEEQKEGGGAEPAGITGVPRKRGAAVSRG
ncbi:hypothetical protein GQ600_13669 [Phytophthora cactorum]|nr:hypothetical protein GQ600_13669 [Phytophthora cactorum]